MRYFLFYLIPILTFLPIKNLYSADASNQKNIVTEDERVLSILNAMSTKYKKFKHLVIEFKYTKIDPDKEEINEINGLLKMSDDSNYKLMIDDHQIITNGIDKWTYSKPSNEVIINKYDPDDDDEKFLKKIKDTILHPTEWLTPVLFEKKEDENIIELEPYEEDTYQDNENIDDIPSKIVRITLRINNSSMELKGWKIETNDGIQQIFEITNLQTKKNFSKKEFIFDKEKFPGIQETDLR